MTWLLFFTYFRGFSMIKYPIIVMALLILAICQTQATVEDPGMEIGDVSATWSGPTTPSIPDYLPSPCYGDSGALSVDVTLTGPESEKDKSYTTQGKGLDFVVTVTNGGSSDAEVEVCVKPMDCALDWFAWTRTSLSIPAGSSRSQNLAVQPGVNAIEGKYRFAVEASAKCRTSASREASFRVQAYDYASETAISGTGQFQMSKDLRSMESGIKSTKDVIFSGSVDALVKNEYMVDEARGKNANFIEKDAVDNYNALASGDALVGTESFKSSAIFGGVGSKVRETYDLQQMEFKSQDFTLHQTGSLQKTAEFKTMDNFTGYYLIDAKQSIPGQKSLKELEEYFGSFEINRRLLFRNNADSEPACQDGDCQGIATPAANESKNSPVASPCTSSSCQNFVNRLNNFGRKA